MEETQKAATQLRVHLTRGDISISDQTSLPAGFSPLRADAEPRWLSVRYPRGPESAPDYPFQRGYRGNDEAPLERLPLWVLEGASRVYEC